MSLTTSDVHRIAHLARLAVSESDVSEVRDQLNGIFSMIEEMRAIDTAGVLPMAHAVAMTQRLREDKVTEQDQRDHYQAIAPAVENGLYLVPKVLE